MIRDGAQEGEKRQTRQFYPSFFPLHATVH